jgi:hypothetical protein
VSAIEQIPPLAARVLTLVLHAPTARLLVLAI